MNPVRTTAYRLALPCLRGVGIRGGSGRPAVVLFKPDRIGDFVLATGAIRFYSRLFEGQPQVLVVSSMVAPLARREFPGIRVADVPFTRGQLRDGLISAFLSARKALRDVNPRMLVSLRHHPTLYDDLLLRCLPQGESFGCCRTRFGMSADRPDFRRFNFTHGVAYPDTERSLRRPSELEAHRRVAELVAGREVRTEEIRPRLETFPTSKRKCLLVLPFASVSIRDYPRGLLVEAIGGAGLPRDMEVIVCGQASEKDRLGDLRAAIEQRTGRKNVRTVYPTSVVALAEEIAAAACVLTMEAAGAHLATVLDKPAAIILGGGHYGMFGPWHTSERQRWLHRAQDCYVCDWHCGQPMPLCITDIPPAQVGACVHELCRQT